MEFILKTFSQLTNSELYEILRLRSEIFVVEQNCVYQDLDNLDQEAFHFLVINEGEIVAYVRMLKPGTRFPEASIGRVVTKIDYRNQGISTLLIRKAIQTIHNDWKANKIKISAQKYLQRFYESLGFVAVTDEYSEDGIPHLGMILTF